MLCICTAGHVNHGKTSIVKALSGVDTDRLQEEKERGLSIELGFAKYVIDKNNYASLIDTPGHENFIRNMISGAHAVDLVIMVIAANEGIKSQTVEHLEILKSLSINRIILVVTKIDLVNKTTLMKQIKEIKKFTLDYKFDNLQVVEVSVKNNIGIDNLKKIINMKVSEEKKHTESPARLSVDRVFTIRGKGTIVTGTLLGSRISKDSSLELMPGSLDVKIKSIESFNIPYDEVSPGTRTSLNIQNLNKDIVERGNIIAQKNYITESDFLYCTLNSIKQIKNKSEIIFHTGTCKAIGKIYFLKNTNVVKIKLNYKIPFLMWDKFLIRNNNGTLGGGKIIFSEKLATEDSFENFVPNESNIIFLLLEKYKVLSIKKLNKFLGKSKVKILESIKNDSSLFLFEKNNYLIEKKILLLEAESLYKEIEGYHRKFPLRNGMSVSIINREKETSTIVKILINKKHIKIHEGFIKKYDFVPTPNKKEINEIDKYIKIINESPFKPATDRHLDGELMSYLVNNKTIIECTGNIYYSYETFQKIKKIVLKLEKENKKINIDILRENLKISRKYCLAILDKMEDEMLIKRSRE